MIRGHRLYAIVPARGGSKGIPRKNLYKLGGISLVERSVFLARRCTEVDSLMVSTDDGEIYALSQRLGVATPSLRPTSLASDSARTIDVIRNLVDDGVLLKSDCILLLQPTTPLRTLADIAITCDLLDRHWDDIDAVVSVTEIDGPNPFKAQVIDNGLLAALMDCDTTVPRQSLPVTYLPNGAIYLAKVDVLLNEDTFLPRRSMPHIMPAIRSINLDNSLDLLLLEAVIQRGLATQALADSSF